MHLVNLAAIATAAMLNPNPTIDESRVTLRYAPAPPDNPLKGLVPYSGANDRFPHSMEFNYLPLSALVRGYGVYDWTPLEKLLNDIASRGHQADFRVFLEYPGKKNAIPAFLLADGLKVHKYRSGNEENETPDYANPNLRKVLKQFIAALGKKYDGDPRIGFITAGLLGAWGEWHTYPREELFASKEVQKEVMDAYEMAFKKTPVLLRYPAGDRNPEKAANSKRRFGYHDDSFAWATLDTGKKGDEWFFMSLLKAAGPEAMDKWKTQPIGGEIRPEAWGKVFDVNPELRQIQDFRKCVATTHASWLMDSGMFRREGTTNRERMSRAIEEVRRMGYEFHVSAVRVRTTKESVNVEVEIENRGVAPFYYDWRVEMGLLAADGRLVKSFPTSATLIGLQPGEKPRIWNETLNVKGLDTGKYHLALRVANPLPKGSPVRFANETQDQHAAGWLTLSDLRL